MVTFINKISEMSIHKLVLILISTIRSYKHDWPFYLVLIETKQLS